MIRIEISPGELLDRITIAELKLANIPDADRLDRIRAESDRINAVCLAEIRMTRELAVIVDALREVNKRIWAAEDVLRECSSSTGNGFVRAARDAYQGNDCRAALKRRINELCGSEIVDVKHYATD